MLRLASLIVIGLVTIAAYILYSYLLSAPAHSDPSIPIPYSNKEGKPMLAELISPANRESASVAPIDRVASRKVETATFALG